MSVQVSAQGGGQVGSPETIQMSAVEQLVSKILEYRRISRQDQQILMSMLLKATLNVHEQTLVNRLHDYLNRGLLRVID